MASSVVQLFLDSMTSTPIEIECQSRYALINPDFYGGDYNSLLFAIVTIDEEKMQLPVDGGIQIGDNVSFVLDSSLSSEFLLLRGVVNIKSGASSSKKEIIHISDSDVEEGTGIHISSDDEKPISQDKNRCDVKQKEVIIESDDRVESTLQFILSSGNNFKLLKKMITSSQVHQVTEEIPQEYNGDCVFELQPSKNNGTSMQGMEQKFDGHCWIKPVATRMSFPAVIRRSKCGGHLMCDNSTCPVRALTCKPNEIAWKGKLVNSIAAVGMTSTAGGSLTCFHCGQPAVLVNDCSCVAYYVLPEGNKTRLLIHQGTHGHPVARGVLRSTIQQTRAFVHRVLREVPTAAPRQLQLNIAKQMVMGSVIRDEGGSLNNIELMSILEEMRPLVQTTR